MRRSAPAKLNLTLAVAPPRAVDGFHPICSWFVPIDLADTVEAERLPAGAPSECLIAWASDAPSPSPIDWPTGKDLACRAHRALEQRTRRALPVRLTVTKRIPVGGGLGGGSSDGAAALLALRELFRLPMTDEDLAGVAITLGSDVPFFLADPPTPAVVEGVGEVIRRTPSCAGAAAALILPPFGVNTGAVYRAFDTDPPPDFRAERTRALADAARVDCASLFNDLAGPAETVEPRLAELRTRAARAASRPVHITGSGSTMFVVCESGAEAEHAARALSAALPGCRTLAARLL